MNIDTYLFGHSASFVPSQGIVASQRGRNSIIVEPSERDTNTPQAIIFLFSCLFLFFYYFTLDSLIGYVYFGMRSLEFDYRSCD